jgi:hypothetical protein
VLAESNGCPVESKKYLIASRQWEIIADNPSKAGSSLAWVSAIDSEGQTPWIVDAHRDNGKRSVVRSDEMLLAFLELERITHELAVSALFGDDGISLSL